MEYCDLFDKNRILLGKIAERGKPLCDGEYITGVEMWIVNNKGELLLTQRHLSKSHPYQWECTGGMVLAGETSIEAIKREVFEEIGLNDR